MSKINELMQTPVTTPEAIEPVIPARVRGAVRFREVRFSYPSTERETLHGVNLEIAAGEPQRYLVVDATLPVTDIAALILERVLTGLAR